MSGTGNSTRARRGRRLVWLDALRGFTVVSMVLYHGMWDAVFLFGLKAPWYDALPGYLWQQSICWTFIFLAGFSWRFDRKPLKRGLLIFGAGALVTLVTTLFMPEDRIVFGVLTLIGSCILLMIPLDRLFRRQDAAAARTSAILAAASAADAGSSGTDAGSPGTIGSGTIDRAGLAIAAALFFLTRDVNSGYLGFESLRLVRLPAGLYRGMFMTYLGFCDPAFFSTDYFSLIPWFFLFCCGYFAHGIMLERSARKAEGEARFPENLSGEQKKIPALLRGLCFLGRHAMAVYIIHQPAILIVLEGIPLLRKMAG